MVVSGVREVNWLRRDSAAPAPGAPLRKSQHLGAVLAMLTCPCHAVPLLFVLGGTAAGAWLAQHFTALIGVLAVVFLFSLWLLFWPAWKRRKASCAACDVETHCS